MPPNMPGFVPGLGVQQPSQIPQITPTPDVPVNYPTGLFAQLVRPPYRATRTAYGYIHPAVVVAPGIVFAPVKTRLAQSSRAARAAHPRLSPPAIVGPGVVFRPISSHLAQTPRRLKTRSYLSQPTTVTAPAVPPVVTRLRAAFAQPHSQRKTISTLAAPTLVGATTPPTVVTLHVTRAPQPQQGRHVGRYGVAPPQIVDLPPAVTTIHVSLTVTQRQTRRPHLRLGRPAILNSPTPTGDQLRIRTRLTPSHRRSRRTLSYQRAPTVVGPAAVVTTRPSRTLMGVGV